MEVTMSLITWDEKYSVNVQKFDQDHKKLVQLINDLHQAMLDHKANDVLGVIFIELANYTKDHFKAEEEAMVKYSYPNFEAHKKLHTELVAQVDKLWDDFKAGKLMMSITVLNFLRDWLVKHILGEDSKYTAFFNAKGLV